jgi:hypothetical protein
MEKEKIPAALQDEINRAFEVAKQSVSLLYSRMDLADIPNGGMAMILKDLVLQHQEVQRHMAG